MKQDATKTESLIGETEPLIGETEPLSGNQNLKCSNKACFLRVQQA